jgi:methionyl-tRNA synthetase
MTHFADTWKVLGLGHDYFVRTTDQRHMAAVTKLLNILKEAKTPDGEDAVYSGVYEGLYCNGCEKFLTESEMADGMCAIHKRPPQVLKENNYFFRLQPYLPIIREKMESGELAILPEERRKEVMGLLKTGLPDFSISRETVKWGVPLPFDPRQVAYVWVDALPNYISAIGFGDDEAQFNKWWNEAEVVHLMAKDILKFHTIYWPAMLMAAGLKIPEKMFIHGYFTVNGEKMGKSAGNMIDPKQMVDIYGTDPTRYLLLNQYPFGVDGDIKEKEFAVKYNADLANDLGNLVSRVAKMMGQYCDGKIPEPKTEIPGQKEMMDIAEDLPDKVYGHVLNFRITDAVAETLNLIRGTNRFIENAAPWKLAKEGDMKTVGGVLYTAAELVRIASILLFPLMPTKMREIRAVFGLDDSSLKLDSARTWFDLPTGVEVKLKGSIFPRLDAKKIPALVAPKEAPADEAEGVITIDDFAKVDLQVAEVKEAEKVPKADKLLKLQISLGSDTRQIVAGIAEHYAPEDLVGKKIIVVANLEPAKIRGIESRGMLLAAKKKKALTLVTVDDDIDPGASVG